jgi:drug/metabolite transporter (DMT)-like permease
MSADRARTMGTSFGLTAILLWASTIAFGRSLTESLGTITTALMVFSIGGTVSVIWLTARGELRTSVVGLRRRYLFGCGALFVVNQISMFIAVGSAVDRLQVLEIGLINYLWPMLTVLLSVPILRMRPGPLLIPGAVVGTLGIGLAMTQNQPIAWATFRDSLVTDPLPYATALIAALTWGLYSNLSRRWGGDSEKGAVPLFLVATAIILALWRFGVVETTVWTPRTCVELAFIVLAMNGAYMLWEFAMRRGDMVLVASASYVTPLLSTFISVLYLGVTTGPKLWIGCALIILGAVTCKLSLSERESVDIGEATRSNIADTKV